MKNHSETFMVVYIVFITVMLVLLPLMWLSASFVIDDALYYPRIAQNIVAGNGATYDRHTHTNGFHPLWLVMLLIPALIAHGDHLIMLRLAFVLSGLLVVTGILSLYGLARQLRWGAIGTVVGLVLLFYPRIDLWLSIMESGATMCILLLTLYLSHRYQLLSTEKTSGNVLFGVLMAMVFLVRLDQVFIVIMMFIGSLYVRIRAGRPCKKLVIAMLTGGFTVGLLVLPYLAANAYFFGNIVPVSGLKKHVMLSSTTEILYAAYEPFVKIAGKLGLPAWFAALLALGFIALGAFSIHFARRYKRQGPRFSSGGVTAFFALGVIVRWLYLRFFIANESTQVAWYWVPEYVLFCISAGYLTACVGLLLPERWRALRAGRVVWTAATVAIAILGTLYIYVDSMRYYHENMVNIENALWARINLPDDKLFGMYDSGIFSYFSQHDTIPLNGLIADRQTMLDSLDKSFNKIMERFNVDYLVDQFDDEQISAIPSGGLIHQSSRKFIKGAYKDKWLCIVDRRIYSPFDH